jgi:hypothetical protein
LPQAGRMDTNRIPKQALWYRPKGKRNIGWLKKWWRDQLHFEDQGAGNMPNPSRTSWWWWNITQVINFHISHQHLPGIITQNKITAWIILTFLHWDAHKKKKSSHQKRESKDVLALQHRVFIKS